MIVRYSINYGGFIGTDEEYWVEVVDDNATEDEIDSIIQDDFEERIRDNCSWERIEDDE